MYRIPADLDLSSVIGEFTTQVRIGQFDLQFTFGRVSFAVQSPVELFRDDVIIARWEEGRWPDAGFYDIMNTPVRRCEVVSDRRIVLEFENPLRVMPSTRHIVPTGKATSWATKASFTRSPSRRRWPQLLKCHAPSRDA